MALDTNETLKRVTYGGKDFILDGIKPSGTLLIEENGTHDVKDYAFAEVSVQPELRERDILGGWNSTIDIGDTRPVFAFGAGGVCFGSGLEGTYTINQSNVILTIPELGGELVATYNFENDTLSLSADGEIIELIRGETVNERNIIGVWTGSNISYEFKPNGELINLLTTNQGNYIISGGVVSLVIDGSSKNVMYDFLNNILINGTTGFGLTKVEQTATLITKEITENGTYKASDDGADGYSEVVVNVAGVKPFADATPEEIQQIGNEISAKGMTSAEVEATYGWKIGDTKDITLTTGEVIQMRIIGFNHDNLTGGGKAGITLDMVDCLNTKNSMNKTRTNAGGYPASRMKTTILPSIKTTLPIEWQNIIVKVDKKSANGGAKNYSETLTTSEDLFLLSQIEVFGTQVTTAQDGTNEGSVYEYWNGKSQGVPFIKKSRAVATFWWLRSCYASIANIFCGVHSTGGGNGDSYADDTTVGVSFAFCVGSSPAPVIAGLPIEATTDADMTNALVEDNLGKVYKFTGTSDTYETDTIYIVSEV